MIFFVFDANINFLQGRKVGNFVFEEMNYVYYDLSTKNISQQVSCSIAFHYIYSNYLYLCPQATAPFFSKETFWKSPKFSSFYKKYPFLTLKCGKNQTTFYQNFLRANEMKFKNVFQAKMFWLFFLPQKEYYKFINVFVLDPLLVTYLLQKLLFLFPV